MRSKCMNTKQRELLSLRGCFFKTNEEGKKVLDEYQIKTAGNLVHEQLPPPDSHFEIEKLNP